MVSVVSTETSKIDPLQSLEQQSLPEQAQERRLIDDGSGRVPYSDQSSLSHRDDRPGLYSPRVLRIAFAQRLNVLSVI